MVVAGEGDAGMKENSGLENDAASSFATTHLEIEIDLMISTLLCCLVVGGPIVVGARNAS